VRKNYTTLIFDAFETVVHINREKLPSCVLEGKAIPTTAPAVHSACQRLLGPIGFDAFFAAFSESWKEIEEMRRTEFREVASQERFRIMLRILGRHAEFPIVEELTRVHMKCIRDAIEIRPDTLNFLKWASARFRSAMISNFDHAPTLYGALDRFGIRSAFEKIMISVEVGWCKPHPVIFERTLTEMGIQASEALFIGDQLYLDVLGGIQAGMDVVWLDSGREVWTTEFPRPTYRVDSISEVARLLETAQ
jgi:putative hydrolase of the HAD superfamily